jgi:hypothetical protein
MISEAHLHVMGKGRNLLMMRGIVPSAPESAISLLPVYPVRQGLQCARCGHHELKSFQEIAVEQHRPEADEPLVQPFLPFPHLQETHYRGEEKRLFDVVEVRGPS